MQSNKLKNFLMIFFFSGVSGFLFSLDNSVIIENELLMKIPILILVLGFLIVFGKLLDKLSSKIRIPSTILQLLFGILIGPYAFKFFSHTYFKNDFFTKISDNLNIISPELFGIVIFASIFILFYYGLLSDTSVFSKYFNSGLVISIVGIAAVFYVNLFLISKFTASSMYEAKNVMFALALSSTSFGITNYLILNKRNKINSVKLTILSSAIVENILLILGFAVFTYLIAFGKLTNNFEYKLNSSVFNIIISWVVFYVISLVFAKSLSKYKNFFNVLMFLYLFIFGFFMFTAGLFQHIGIPMIVSAYLFGLIISKTNYNYLILGFFRHIYYLLAPLFFIICGMFVNLEFLLSQEILKIILICSGITIVVKFMSTFMVSLFFDYSPGQAKNIGLGLISRGELGLVICLVSINFGSFDVKIFTIILAVMIITALINNLLKPLINRKSKKDDFVMEEFVLGSLEFINIISFRILDNFKNQGFKITTIDLADKVVFYKRGDLFFSFKTTANKMIFESHKNDMPLVKTLFYEILLDFNKNINQISGFNNIGKLIEKESGEDKQVIQKEINIKDIFNENNIILDLKAAGKNEVIDEMLNLLYTNGQIKDKEEVRTNLLEREKIISTGMQQGIAIPHCKGRGIDKTVMAVGLKKNGLPFDSIDGKPSKIFIMILTPENEIGAHLHILMTVSSILNKDNSIEKLLNMSDKKSIWDFFINSKVKK